MKKIFFIPVISLFILSYSSAQIEVKKKKTDLEIMKLKGKVKSVSEYFYWSDEKIGEVLIYKGKREKISSTIFNNKGNIIETNVFSHSLSDVSLDYLFMDRRGRITLKYDDKGNKIEENYYNTDGSLGGKVTYKYDGNGNKIEFQWYITDGSFVDKRTWKYDNKGNQTELNYYKTDGSLRDKTTFKYDDKGNQIENNYYKADGSLGRKTTYKYDGKGNMVEMNDYDTDGSLGRKTTYKYDDKGNKIEWNDYKGNVILRTTSTTVYDDKGNSITTHGEETDASLVEKYTYKYVYDKNLNWIKVSIFKIDRENYYKKQYLYSTTERVIEYF